MLVIYLNKRIITKPGSKKGAILTLTHTVGLIKNNFLDGIHFITVIRFAYRLVESTVLNR